MRKNIGFLLAAALILVGSLMIWIGLQRPLSIITPERVEVVNTRAWKTQSILAEAGYRLTEYDETVPSLKTLVGWSGSIQIRRASRYRIIDLTRGLDITIPSLERMPANVFQEAGIAIFPGDRILWNGQAVDLEQPLPYQETYLLQIVPTLKVELLEEQKLQRFYSSAPSLGQALWSAGIVLQTTDRISEGLHTPLRFLETVQIERSRPLRIRVGAMEIHTMTAARTIGEALNQSGISLQGMDYTLPSEHNPLPDSGWVEVVRVHEEIVLEQTTIPYESTTVLDPETPLDQRRIIESGQYGLKISRERIRYENDEEAGRIRDAEWIAALPQPELVGIGTQVVLGTVDTPQGPLEYWRSLSAYATSYSPCRLGTGECSYTTAAGMELKKGVVAVKCSIFPSLRGQQVYVPGYGIGIIGDCGGGVTGSFWIDLGFSEEDYETWHQTVTVYFLAPVPATIPYELY